MAPRLVLLSEQSVRPWPDGSSTLVCSGLAAGSTNAPYKPPPPAAAAGGASVGGCSFVRKVLLESMPSSAFQTPSGGTSSARPPVVGLSAKHATSDVSS